LNCQLELDTILFIYYGFVYFLFPSLLFYVFILLLKIMDDKRKEATIKLTAEVSCAG